jgi:hypothetical protein
MPDNAWRRSHRMLVLIIPFSFAMTASAAGWEGAQLTKAGAAEIVQKIERMSVADLDPSLPPQPLGVWLKSLFGPDASAEWEVSDCDLKPEAPEPSIGYPMCVTARVGRARLVGVKLHILVGADKRGVFGKPEVQPQSFVGCSSPKGLLAGMDFRGVEKLSDLPKQIEALRAGGKCN